jgi:hypothetical protein
MHALQWSPGSRRLHAASKLCCSSPQQYMMTEFGFISWCIDLSSSSNDVVPNRQPLSLSHRSRQRRQTNIEILLKKEFKYPLNAIILIGWYHYNIQ